MTLRILVSALALLGGIIGLGAQSFTEIARSPFAKLRFGTTDFLDVDGDGDADLFVTGSDAGNAIRALLYINDGKGGFAESLGQPFVGITDGAVDYADIDLDGDLDLVASGVSGNNRQTIIYLNDGKGRYRIDARNAIPGHAKGTLDLVDLDEDGDADLIISGTLESNEASVRLYMNSGGGLFTEVSSGAVVDVYGPSIATGDVDGDGDMDFFVSGEFERVAMLDLYINAGNFEFVRATRMPLSESAYGAVRLADINGDGALDLTVDNVKTAKLECFFNDKFGVFEKDTLSSIPTFRGEDILLTDIDRDGDLDVVGSTFDFSVGAAGALYLNDGRGRFTNRPSPFIGLIYRSSAAADIDGDGDVDYYFSGNTSLGPSSASSNLYVNRGEGRFLDAEKVPFLQAGGTAVGLIDINGDDLADLILSGSDAGENRFTGVYVNAGEANFERVTDAGLPPLSISTLVYADVDLDGDEDIFLYGQNVFGDFSGFVYVNNGTGRFAADSSTLVVGSAYVKAAFADVNTDGYPDLVTMGSTAANQPSALLYLNDGLGGFGPGRQFGVLPLMEAGFEFVDVDQDGDPDLVTTGRTINVEHSATLYLNDGTNVFTAASAQNFKPVVGGVVKAQDIDGDGDLDVLITGYDTDYKETVSLYVNGGRGDYTLSLSSVFRPVADGTAAFADIDGDGDSDLLLAGRQGRLFAVQSYTDLYLNDGRGTFSQTSAVQFPGVASGASAFADIDGDGDQDLLLTGTGLLTPFRREAYRTMVYLNNGSASFTPPRQHIAEMSIAVYPNPVFGSEVCVQVAPGPPAVLEVYDLSGRVVSTTNYPYSDSPRTLRIPMYGIAAGAYLIRLTSQTGVGQAVFTVLH